MNFSRSCNFLQCGRIYKDAEMKISAAKDAYDAATFNVAASIKMRKWAASSAALPGILALQCGRIYKDAEIRRPPLGLVARPCLQCGRIYKDAEIPRVYREV